jgi:hypothetical protein
MDYEYDEYDVPAGIVILRPAVSKKGYILEITDYDIAKRLSRWSFAEMTAWGLDWGLNIEYWQFVIQIKKWKCTCKMLGIKKKKSPGRVKAGKKASKTHPIHEVKGAKSAHRGMENHEVVSQATETESSHKISTNTDSYDADLEPD